MNAWVYQGALLCDKCAEERCLSLCREASALGIVPFEPGEDSEYYPQGPYPNGGGEADSPQHCDKCMVFLENPLTDEGRRYTQQAITVSLLKREHKRLPLPVSLSVWAPFYGIKLP